MGLTKLAGIGLIVGGLAMVFVFPDITKWSYQPKEFSYAGILVGIFLIIIGTILLLV